MWVITCVNLSCVLFNLFFAFRAQKHNNIKFNLLGAFVNFMMLYISINHYGIMNPFHS